jgi:membrane protease subunit HflK
VVLALLIMVLTVTCVNRVDQGEEGLVLTFGRVTERLGPGVYLRLPFIQSVRAESVSTIYTQEYGYRTTQIGSASSAPLYDVIDEECWMLTSDDCIVEVDAIYYYSVNDVQQYLFAAENPTHALHLAFEAVLRRHIQAHTLDDALLSKETMEHQILQDFQALIDTYQLGILAHSVRIQNIFVPQSVLVAYDDVNNAKNETSRRTSEAERYRNQVIPAARSTAYAALQSAEAYRAEVMAQAEAEAAAFERALEQYNTAPAITRKALLIETLESILKNADRKVLLDKGQALLLEDLRTLGGEAVE